MPHKHGSKRRGWEGVSLYLERSLGVLGVLALIYCSAVLVGARAAQGASAGFGRPHHAASPTQEQPSNRSQETEVPALPGMSGTGAVMGRIEIPGLLLSAPITDGIGKEDLLRGVGHIPRTALAGGLGTMGLAGHRDTFFRPLRKVTPGMEIRIADAEAVYHYRVDSTEIVSPEDVAVLDIEARPALTLITCFPFDFIGAAPRRFIVHAHLLSAAPEVEMGPSAR